MTQMGSESKNQRDQFMGTVKRGDDRPVLDTAHVNAESGGDKPSGWDVSPVAWRVSGAAPSQRGGPAGAGTGKTSSGERAEGTNGPLRVVVTVAWWAIWSGKSAALTSPFTQLMGAGVDPHLYKPRGTTCSRSWPPTE